MNVGGAAQQEEVTFVCATAGPADGVCGTQDAIGGGAVTLRRLQAALRAEATEGSDAGEH